MSIVTNKVDFQEWLQTSMDNRGWGQSDLASRAGVDRQIVYGWLKLGKKPNEENLQRIAKAFEMPYEIVYKAAGLKLSPTSTPEDIQQAAYEMEDMNPQDREVSIHSLNEEGDTLEMTMRYVHFVKSDLASAHRIASPADNWRL